MIGILTTSGGDGETTVAARCHHLEVAAGPAKASRRLHRDRWKRSRRPQAHPERGGSARPGLQSVVHLAPQLPAREHVRRRDGQNDGDGDGAGGTERRAGAQAHELCGTLADLSLAKRITDATDGLNHPRLAAGLGLAAQVADVDIQ